jgi:DNA polymerase-3 subunit epsilon
VKLSRLLYPEHHRHNLDSLIERHGLQVDGRHRALADARLIHQFWAKIHVDRSHDEIEAALKKLCARPSLPSHLDAAVIDDLPDTPGVYLFHGENDLPLYVGKAKDLRRRVLSHFAADHASAKEMSLAQQVRRIEWIETAGEIGALLKEAALVKELLPTHNRQLRRNDDACTWTLVDEGEGWLRPQVAWARDLDFGLATSCYGLFKSGREATGALRALAESHNLCDILLGLEKAKAGKPCFGHQLRRCKGACIGHEPPARHTMRLVAALTALKLAAWPFAGPALIREGEEAHLVEGWRYLGTARSDDDLTELLAAGRPQFDRDTYRILARHIDKMTPLRRAG